MKKSIYYSGYFILLIVTLILNHFYGSFLYSRVVGQEQEYTIGKLCGYSLNECENTYFSAYLKQIDTLSNANRSFFSDIFIQDDQIGYIGNCPCPYDTDTSGGSCGGRSSYSKNGKISYCYDTDVSDSLIASKRASMITDVRTSLDSAVQKDLDIYNEKYTLVIILILFLWIGYYMYGGFNHGHYGNSSWNSKSNPSL